MPLINLTLAQIDVLRIVLEQAPNTEQSVPGGRSNSAWSSGDSWQTPEVYVALVPSGGIPALDFGEGSGGTGTGTDVGVITGTGLQADTPGSARCQIWKIIPDGLGDFTIVRVGNQTQLVFNLSTTAIDQQWVSIHKTSFGRWIAGISSVSDVAGSVTRYGILDADLIAATNALTNPGTAELSIYDGQPDIVDTGKNLTVVNRNTETGTIVEGTFMVVIRHNAEWVPIAGDCDITTIA